MVLRVKILLKYHWMRDVTFVCRLCCAGIKHSNECATSTHLLASTIRHTGASREHSPALIQAHTRSTITLYNLHPPVESLKYSALEQ